MAYLRLAPYAAILALVFAVMWFWHSADNAKAALEVKATQLAAAQEANKTNLDTIDRLTKQRAADDAILSNLATRLGELNAQSEAVRANVGRLERSSATVRAFLATRLPPDLGRLLNARRTDANAR